MKLLTCWKCPGCGWLISDLEYKSMRFNLNCPRCEKHPFSAFNRVKV